MMTLRRGLLPLLVALLAVAGFVATSAPAGAAAAKRGHGPSWTLVDPGVVSHYRGLAAVSRTVAWISGYDGVVRRTVDGGKHWIDASPAGATALQFRDISATDSRHAVAMAAGSGTDSRLYVTSDGGKHWSLAYQNTDDAAFFDCMSFSDARHGLVTERPGRRQASASCPPATAASTWTGAAERRHAGSRRPARPGSPPAVNA